METKTIQDLSIFPQQFDPAKFDILLPPPTSQPNILKASKRGMKRFGFTYNGGPLIVQFPFLGSPFGISKFTAQDKETGRKTVSYSVTLNLDDDDGSLEFAQHFDNCVKEFMKLHPSMLGKPTASEEIIEHVYAGFCKASKTLSNGTTTTPQARIRVPDKKGKILTRVFMAKSDESLDDPKETIIDFPENQDKLFENTKIATVVEFVDMWNKNDKEIGVTVVAHNLIIGGPREIGSKYNVTDRFVFKVSSNTV